MNFVEELKRRMQTVEQPTRVLFPEATDPRVIEAALRLKEDGLVVPVLVHTPTDVSERHKVLQSIVVDEAKASDLGRLLTTLRSHKGMTDEEARRLAQNPLVYGMYLLRMGEVDALVAGVVNTTADVIRPALWLLDKKPGIQTISSAFYMLVPPFRGPESEVLTFADCGIIEVPTAEQLADIAISAADARRFVVGDAPHVAFLSFSTKGSGGSGESIVRIQTAIALVSERRPDISLAEYELQGDAALIETVGQKKAPGSAVAGKANVLIFPSLDAGNIAYKLVARLVPEAKEIGPIVHGFEKIVHDTSRGVTADGIYLSALVAAVRAQESKHSSAV